MHPRTAVFLGHMDSLIAAMDTVVMTGSQRWISQLARHKRPGAYTVLCTQHAHGQAYANRRANGQPQTDRAPENPAIRIIEPDAYTDIGDTSHSHLVAVHARHAALVAAQAAANTTAQALGAFPALSHHCSLGVGVYPHGPNNPPRVAVSVGGIQLHYEGNSPQNPAALRWDTLRAHFAAALDTIADIDAPPTQDWVVFFNATQVPNQDCVLHGHRNATMVRAGTPQDAARIALFMARLMSGSAFDGDMRTPDPFLVLPLQAGITLSV